MSQVHLIIVCLVIFLVGATVLFYVLFPTLRAAMRERTLPRILTRCLALALSWIALYFVSLLLNYYRLVTFPHYYTVILAGLVAAIPWITLYWYWRWREQLDRERAASQIRKGAPDEPHHG